jgi:hypothetical protein
LSSDWSPAQWATHDARCPARTRRASGFSGIPNGAIPQPAVRPSGCCASVTSKNGGPHATINSGRGLPDSLLIFLRDSERGISYFVTWPPKKPSDNLATFAFSR